MMSELDALSNAPDMVETRMVETGEAVAADGMRIDSPIPHSHGSLATPEASDLASRADDAADSGFGKLSTPSLTTRQHYKGARTRTKHVHAMLM